MKTLTHLSALLLIYSTVIFSSDNEEGKLVLKPHNQQINFIKQEQYSPSIMQARQLAKAYKLVQSQNDGTWTAANDKLEQMKREQSKSEIAEANEFRKQEDRMKLITCLGVNQSALNLSKLSGMSCFGPVTGLSGIMRDSLTEIRFTGNKNIEVLELKRLTYFLWNLQKIDATNSGIQCITYEGPMRADQHTGLFVRTSLKSLF
jgi:hypothetical protein